MEALAKVKPEGEDEQNGKSSMQLRKKATTSNDKANATAIKTGQYEGAELAMGDAEQEPQTPSLKKRRRSTRKGAFETAAVSPFDEDIDPTSVLEAVSPTKAEGMTVRNTPRKRTAPKALAAPRGIPSSWEDADDADKVLITLKEAGDDWSTIWKVPRERTAPKIPPLLVFIRHIITMQRFLLTSALIFGRPLGSPRRVYRDC